MNVLPIVRDSLSRILSGIKVGKIVPKAIILILYDL